MKLPPPALALLAVTSFLYAEPSALPEWDAAANTAVVFNPDFPESQALASYYAGRRGIAADHIVGIPCPPPEAISREGFDERLRDPLKKVFDQRHWWEADSRIFILVLIHGVPSKIIRQHENPRPSDQDEASVDSELCLLGAPPARLGGAAPNPYFNKKERFNTFARGQRQLLVCRLDAASPATVRRMIDDAIATEKTGLLGRAVLDLALKTGAYKEGDDWLLRSAQTCRSNGIPVFVDHFEPVLREDWPLPDTALYFGWYAGEITGALKSPSFRFKPGAIACHLHSFSAGTIRTADHAWVGPILEHGAAATMGNVWEPYLSLTIHFDVLNERLMEGCTLAEAAWNATPGLSWQNVVLGDPLYRPFKEAGAMGADADRDYAMYKALVKRHAADASAKELKDELLAQAGKHNSPRLLELLALYSAGQGRLAEAAQVMDHARSVCQEPADRLRLTLYQADLLRRDHNDGDAAQVLEAASRDGALKGVPGHGLIAALLKELRH